MGKYLRYPEIAPRDSTIIWSNNTATCRADAAIRISHPPAPREISKDESFIVTFDEREKKKVTKEIEVEIGDF